MKIQSFSQTDTMDVRRQGPPPGPRASIDERTFKAERGGAARVSSPGVLSRLGNLLRNLKFWFCPSSTPARPRHKNMIDVPEFAPTLGGLLGSLMARANDSQAMARIAKELTQSEQQAEAELLILLRHSRAKWKSMSREEGLAGLKQWSKRPVLRSDAKGQNAKRSGQAKEQPGLDRNSKLRRPPIEVKSLTKSRIEDAMARSGRAQDWLSPVPALGAEDLARIVQGLTQLSRLTQGDLVRLPAQRELLTTHLDAMDYSDLNTLRHGILSHWSAREEVLDQVEPELRLQAQRVLSQIAAAVNQRLANEVVQKPLNKIEEIMSSSSVNGQELQTELIKLHTSLVMLDFNGGGSRPPAPSLLDVYLQSLPIDQAQGLLRVLDSKKTNLVEHSPPQNEQIPVKPQSLQEFLLEQPQARVMLDRLHASLRSEVQARAQPE